MDSSTTLNDDARSGSAKDLEASQLPVVTFPQKPTQKESVFFPVPQYLRPPSAKETFELGLGRICLLSVCTAFLVANLAYTLPLLNRVENTFRISREEVAEIPTMIGAGYATGTIFISPLGDLVRRRQLVLILVLISASLTVGLALTSSYLVFRILAFLLGISTISPQIIVALARDHAPLSYRTTAYAIILSGSLSGTLAARLLGGIIADSVNWKFVFYFAFAAQYTILILFYFSLPDVPKKTKDLTYTKALRIMAIYAVTDPTVVQTELTSMILGIAVASYSITLTFILGGQPYHYSTLQIGIFGLTELIGIIISPMAGSLVDRISPWKSILLSSIGLVLFQIVQVVAGGTHPAALIIRSLGIDAIRQLQYISLAAFIYKVSIESASRLNALFVFSYYLGQMIGASSGPKVLVTYGWRATAVFGLASYFAQIVILILRRGPKS